MTAWFDTSAFYHIYPLGLCGCPHENDYSSPAAPGAFEKLHRWIDHAADMGFTAVYIGPLFQSKTHGYDTTDFRLVDSRLGTNGEFGSWCDHCHERGVAVVVDGVFNHTGRDFFAFQDLLARKWDSWAKDWYCGVNFDCNNAFDDGFSYESWRGIDILPRLNLANPDVRSYLLDTVRLWYEEFSIDGIRLDSADVLDFGFMRDLRDMARTLKPDFWLMGEVIHGDYGRWVNDGMLDSVTNYELHKAIYSAHNSHNYFEVGHNILRLFGPYGLCRDARLYNFCDNQDVNRISSMLNDQRDLMPVYVLLFSVLGIPSVYYGSEFGIGGRKEGNDARSDDPLRPELYLDRVQGNNPELTALIRRLLELKRQVPELSYGSYIETSLQNLTYAFARHLPAGAGPDPSAVDLATITCLNNGDAPSEQWLDLPFAATSVENLTDCTPVEIVDGKLRLTIDGHSGLIARIS